MKFACVLIYHCVCGGVNSTAHGRVSGDLKFALHFYLFIYFDLYTTNTYL